jgi:anti-sigma regulatory factor (Ser/Thr protein kinase)
MCCVSTWEGSKRYPSRTRVEAPARPSRLPLEPAHSGVNPVRRTSEGLPLFLKSYVLVGSGILIALLLLYTHNVVNRLNSQVEILSGIIARFCAMATFPALESPESQDVFRSIVEQADFPIVVTDSEGRPWAWKGIGINAEQFSLKEIAGTDPDHPTGVMAKVIRIIEELDKDHAPVAMLDPATGGLIGYVHYGEWSLVKQLRFIPFAQVGVVALFVAIGYWGYRSLKLGEQRSIWVGMAKETAHQLGTPLSSLMGWLEILRDEPAEGGPRRHEEIVKIVDEMDRDVRRLGRVASRFGHIGSVPNLKSQDIAPIVSEAVRYVKTRIPRGARSVEIREQYGEVQQLNVNAELLGWAVENVLVNCLDAMDKPEGMVEVTVGRRPETETVEIWIKDNGKGMSGGEARKVFMPGYSTKKRGWGLGLTLARRIVEEYHGGRIWVDSSQPGEGTLFKIAFPV